MNRADRIAENAAMAETGQKRCRDCDAVAPLTEFYGQGRSPYCKGCHRLRMVRAGQARAARRRAQNGTGEAYERLLRNRAHKAEGRWECPCGAVVGIDQRRGARCRRCAQARSERAERARLNAELLAQERRMCKECRQIKPLAAFYRTSRVSGYQTECIDCFLAREAYRRAA